MSSNSSRRRDSNNRVASQRDDRETAEAGLWMRWQYPPMQPGGIPCPVHEPSVVWQRAVECIDQAVYALHVGHEATLLISLESLASVTAADYTRLGLAVIESHLVDQVAERFTAGWQPLDLDHVVGKLLGDQHRALLLAVLGVERSLTANIHVDPRWQSQLDSLDVAVVPGQDTEPCFVPVRAGDLADEFRHIQDVRTALELLAALRRIPQQALLMAPPSQRPIANAHAAAPGAKLDERILVRVRGLLAKAESTGFDEEADALTAKAQELMARHAIDLAMIDAGAPQISGVEGRRVHVEDPYFEAKAVLLTVVADANRCSAVMDTMFGIVTVFGFPADLDITELLFTSLLTQATSSMVAAGKSVDYAGTSRTKSFRRTFIISFATRVGERLREAGEAATADAVETFGGSLLPVLTSRTAQVQAHQDTVFPNVRAKRSSVSNAAGWHAGRDAANRALLNANARGIKRS